MAFPSFPYGTVRDGGGSPVQGATVSWSPGDASKTTDGNGMYYTSIVPGTYDVTASGPPGEDEKTGINYPSAQSVGVDFTLT